MELDCCVGHLEPPNVDIREEVVRERRHLATVDNEIGNLVAAESLDCVL